MDEPPALPPPLRPPPWMDHEPGFKDSAFSWEMGALILDRILAGETVRQITADPAMPSYATVYRWTRVWPDFGAAWDEVRAAAAVWMHRETAGRRRRNGSGARSTYTACMALTICWEVERGAALSEVLRRPGRPSAKAVYGWLRRRDGFRAAYAQACRWRDFELRDRAADLAIDRGIAARREVDAIVGRAGLIRPRVFRAR